MAAAASTSIGIHCDASVTLGNGSGTDFQASKCIPMDIEAAAAALSLDTGSLKFSPTHADMFTNVG